MTATTSMLRRMWSEGVERRMARAREALAEQRRTGTVRMVPAYEAGNERAGMSFAMDYYANPERGAVPAWSNEMAEASWLHWLSFDGLAAASSAAVPTLLVHSDGCALPDNARRVHERLKGPKELAWMGTGTQTDYYDRPSTSHLLARGLPRFSRARWDLGRRGSP
jgi:hypothetical protein